MAAVTSGLKQKSAKKKKLIDKVHELVPRTGHSMDLCGAVTALELNAIRKMTESKTGMVTEVTYPPEILRVARGLFPAGRTYDFQLHASGTIASTAGGVVNTRISWDPSVVSYTEWSALAALFDEVVFMGSQIDITSAYGPTSTAIVVQYQIAPDRDGISGASPSYTTVQRLAESEPFHSYTMAGKPGVFTKVHRMPYGTRPYATTAVPGGASGSPAGALGQFSIASNIVTTPSINVLFWSLKTLLRFRNRA